jgi:hypothetical protein
MRVRIGCSGPPLPTFPYQNSEKSIVSKTERVTRALIVSHMVQRLDRPAFLGRHRQDLLIDRVSDIAESLVDDASPTAALDQTFCWRSSRLPPTIPILMKCAVAY